MPKGCICFQPLSDSWSTKTEQATSLSSCHQWMEPNPFPLWQTTYSLKLWDRDIPLALCHFLLPDIWTQQWEKVMNIPVTSLPQTSASRTQGVSGSGWWQDTCPESENTVYYCPLPPSRSLPVVCPILWFLIDKQYCALHSPFYLLIRNLMKWKHVHPDHQGGLCSMEITTHTALCRPPPLSLLALFGPWLHKEYLLPLLLLHPLGSWQDFQLACPVLLSKLQ